MKKILLIEDEETLRIALADRLTMEGYAVVTASDGQEGLACVLAERPDLILCDVMMPVVDGYEVLQKVKSFEETRSIPFVFLSAKADPRHQDEGLTRGADGYVSKPVTKVDLLAAIRRHIP
jgi:CheY-like chemotaxis protein